MANRATADGDEGHGTVSVHLPMTFRRRGGRKLIVIPGDQARRPQSSELRIVSPLLKAVVRAYRWREMIECGKYACAADLAKAEKVNDSYLSRVLRLTLLSPDIVEAIVSGRQPSTLQVDDLLGPLPCVWEQQKSNLGWPQPAIAR